MKEGSILKVSNSIIAGNFKTHPLKVKDDIVGAITFSNGHNVFGSDVDGDIVGDRVNIAPAALFAAIDPVTGGGKLGADGTVALRNNVANPALSAGDPILANVFDQRGATRPQPGGSLPDLGAAELNQPLSTAKSNNNDVLTGTNAVNKLTGLAGADYLKGLGGNDTLEGGLESDMLDGGPGNDTLQGGLGLDLAAYPGAAGVVIDLSGTTDTAKRGAEKDTLIGIEGALGSNAADTFKGDKLNNEFQGKTGKDTMTGGGGRDTWDFNAVADSPAGATRDLVIDFVSGEDVIDLAGVDADSTVPGNQSFRWVAKANLSGAAQLGYFVSGGTTIVRASTDADAAAELEIQLTGTKTLTAGDFRP
jgi:Ca2+-binding RTX toxin-like protein